MRPRISWLAGVLLLLAACGGSPSAGQHKPHATVSTNPANVPNAVSPSAQTSGNQPAGWVGMNYNWTHSFTEARGDLTTIKSWGINRVRLNIVDWNSSEEISHWRDITVEALNQGFYVLYGLSQGPDNTTANEAAYLSVVQAEATWAQTQRNARLELVVGNEAELHPSDRSKAPRDFIRRLAAAAKAIYTYGKISYDTSAYDWAINGWLNDPEGLGALDRLGLNLFYSDDIQFRTAIFELQSKYRDHFYVSEWNVDGGFTRQSNVQTYGAEVASCLRILKTQGIGEAYYYNFLDLGSDEGTYGVETPNGTFNVSVEQLLQHPDAA